MIDQLELSAGDLLIAPPKMVDPRFQKTVIMLTHHSEDGSLGLVLNKPTEHSVDDLVAEVGLTCPFNCDLFWGGPVNPQTVWMLHTPEWQLPTTHKFSMEWSMTSSMNMFHEMERTHKPDYFRMFFGFASWGPDQLVMELEGHGPWRRDSSWLVWHQPHGQQLLDVDSEDLWSVATEQCARQAVNSWL